MRKLGIKDAFQLSKILDKMEIRFDINELMDEAQALIKQGNIEKAQSFLGGQLTMTVVSKLHKAEKEVIEWLASINEISVEDIEKLSMKELIVLIQDLFKAEDFMELFQ